MTGVDGADRDEELLTASHRARVQIAADPGAPVLDDLRVVIPRADRRDGIQVRGRDGVDVVQRRASNLEGRAVRHHHPGDFVPRTPLHARSRGPARPAPLAWLAR